MRIAIAKARLQGLVKTLKQGAGYNTKKAVKKAKGLEHLVCTQEYDIVAKQAKLLLDHGINKIMFKKKLLTKLVAYGLVINNCGLYSYQGHDYSIALHCTVNHLIGNGKDIGIVGVDEYLKCTDIAKANEFLAKFALPINTVNVTKDDNGHITSVTGCRRDFRDNEYNLSFNVVKDEFQRPGNYSAQSGTPKNIIGGNDNGRFRFNIPVGSGCSRVLYERGVMILTLCHTNEFPVFINNINGTFEDGLKSMQANVMTGNAQHDTSLDIAKGWNGIRCVEPVLSNNNGRHAQSIGTVSEIVNKYLNLGQGKAVVAFSANDKVIEELCNVYRSYKDEQLAYFLFRYIISVCDIYLVY